MIILSGLSFAKVKLWLKIQYQSFAGSKDLTSDGVNLCQKHKASLSLSLPISLLNKHTLHSTVPSNLTKDCCWQMHQHLKKYNTTLGTPYSVRRNVILIDPYYPKGRPNSKPDQSRLDMCMSVPTQSNTKHTSLLALGYPYLQFDLYQK